MYNWFKGLFKSSPRTSMKKSNTAGGLACKEVVELVSDYLEGVLLPEKRAALEEHLAGCPGCTNYVEQVRLTIDMLRNLAQEPVFPETKEELLQVFRQWKAGT